MIFCTNKTWKYKKQQREKWRRWFAWYPVEIEELPDGSVIRAWCQWVWRKGEYWASWDDDGWIYEYKYHHKEG